MSKVRISLEDGHDLAMKCLTAAGCDDANARAVADTVIAAERDGCHSHGLFRLPGYLASLKSGKVNGAAKPSVQQLAGGVVQVDGDMGYAPLALAVGREPLAAAARENGIAALSIVRTHHFAALWIETSALAEMGLAAFAFTAYMPAVAPAGGAKPFFGTNPMSFAWPRPGKPPMVFDQAAAAMARGEIMIAARDGHVLPPGAGVDAAGQPTTDPNAILNGGAQLAFGGYKGAAIALMIELLVGPLIGEAASPAAGRRDNKDGGPPTSGELLIAIDPARFGGKGDYAAQAEELFAELLAQEGTRLPGDRRYANRERTPQEGFEIPKDLYDKITAAAG